MAPKFRQPGGESDRSRIPSSTAVLYSYEGTLVPIAADAVSSRNQSQPSSGGMAADHGNEAENGGGFFHPQPGGDRFPPPLVWWWWRQYGEGVDESQRDALLVPFEKPQH